MGEEPPGTHLDAHGPSYGEDVASRFNPSSFFLLFQSFTSCCIGSAGHRTTTTSIYPSPSHSPDLGFPSHPSLSRSQSFPASLAPHTWTPIPSQPPREGLVSTTVAGSQDTEWGTPTSLEGHLGSVAIFYEALQQTQVKALFSLGMWLGKRTHSWGGLSTLSRLALKCQAGDELVRSASDPGLHLSFNTMTRCSDSGLVLLYFFVN